MHDHVLGGYLQSEEEVTNSANSCCDCEPHITEQILICLSNKCRNRASSLGLPLSSANRASRCWESIRYDTIRYDSVYLTCSKTLTGSQLSPPHGKTKKLKCETENNSRSETRTIKECATTLSFFRSIPW